MQLFRSSLPLGILLLLGQVISAQHQHHAADSTLPLYREYPIIPQFSTRRIPDSLSFQKKDLREKRTTLIMLFSPDCEHCQQAIENLKSQMDQFRKVEILLVSHLPFDLLKAYYEKHQLNQYPNVTMVRDGSYMLGTFYRLRNYPSFFLYNKKGDLVEAFEGTVPVERIASRL